ncbi:MAG: DUF2130 domain-containing protein [Fimbriimonadaceae bacterium]|nr:DUF2130 domain-containing protein [Fimbriimonadaceae bacterium]QYK58721.1 MAG: DUF2130 domain-containing protein [Fimbriimonadaceae bacterium]
METTFRCPQCGTDIELTETLFQPFIQSVEQKAREQVAKAQREAEEARKSANHDLAQAAAQLKEAADLRASIETEVNQRLAAERLTIQAQEREALRKELAPEIEAERHRAKELEAKLTQAQQAELALRKEKDDLERRAREMDLEVARRVDEQRKSIAEDAQKAAAEAMNLRLAEKDKTIADMQTKLEEAQRKGAQGSQQLQGEVLELDLEQRLQSAFPWDEITPVKQGARGGDLLQRVSAQPGVVSGVVYWEAKRAANWSPEWIVKAKQDARAAGAEAIVIVTTALPKGESTLCLVDGVVVCPVGLEVPVAHMLRNGLVEAANARKASEGRGTKEALIYSYLTGPQFKAWLTGIAEPFVQMQKDLESEVNATTTRWKKRRKQIERVRDSVAGMFGDLQGIVGAEMPELPGFVEEVEEDGE